MWVTFFASQPSESIATDTTFAPFEFQDDKGNYVGIDMDLIREIAKDQHFNVDIKPLGFDAALQAVRAKHDLKVCACLGLLNEEQVAVVEAGEGPILVVAGAGSGKTRTLTYRVAYLLSKGVKPGEILLLTFIRWRHTNAY